MKKLFLLIVLISANTAFAATPSWTGTVSQDWGVGGNWSTGLVPIAGDSVTVSGSPGPLINSTAIAGSVKVNGPLEMSGGSLTTNTSWVILGYEAGTNGTLTLKNGTITTTGTMYVGFNGNGTMYMNGGTINVNGARFGIAYNSASSVGHVYLNGGTITCLDFSMAKNLGAIATMDITGGKLIINGDKTATVGPYISSGWITAYGGAGVQIDYNVTTLGKTTVMSGAAVPVATNPNPANAAINVATNASLSWAAGVGAVSHNVYFGTADPPAFIVNQTAATYSPGTLAVNKTYYWRIDEVDDSNNVHAGTVWSFTTESGFKKSPYLIYPGNNTQMTVLWQMTSTVACTLAWGLDTSYSAGNTGTTEYGTDHQHKYAITGLTPGTKYYYRITSGDAQTTGSFRTAPAATATSVKFFAYGDTRTNPGSHNTVCGAMNSVMTGDPDFQTILLHSGDWVATDSESNWDAEYFSRLCSSTLQLQANIPIQGCMGNHETTGTGPTIYDKYWPYTYAAPASGRYLSFDYGPAHIAIVDLYSSFAPESDQLTWLANDLSSTTKKWKFIVLHEPGWTAGDHPNNADVQANIQPLCEMYDVQAVFCGHNHYYSRAVVNGVHHITTGAGGAPFYSTTPGMPYIVTYTANVLEFCKVAISGDLLSFQAVGSDGTVIDAFNIDMIKATNPNPSNGAANVTNSTLTWTAGTTAASHDIYFGTANPPALITNQTATTYNPGTLTAGITYYWRIDERDSSEQTTTGDVWSFTTAAPVVPNPINIHLSWDENNVSSTMLVKWATLTDANSMVRYGLTSGYGSQKTGTSVWSSVCSQYVHTVELTGLSPNTTYHYSCGSSVAWSTDATFTTGLPAGDPNEFVFALGGDTRNPDDIVPNATYAGYRINVMNTVLLQQPKPKFFMFLGDWTDRGRYQDQWNELFDNLKPQLTTMPYMMVWGSHEDPDLYPNAFAQFDYPSNGTPADQDRYYSFDYGNAHFSVLFATAAAASNPLTEHLIPAGSAQYNWLVSDLQRASSDPNIEWKFMLVHAPPYSTATRSAGGSCVGLRQDIGPLAEQYGVNVVFTAHEHNFERTHLISNDTKLQDVPIGAVVKSTNGTIYYVSGGAGAGLNSCDGNAWFSATYQNLRHFLLVRVNGKTLNIKAVRDNGSILDEINFEHYKLGDFDSSGKIDMKDLSVFTGYWLDSGLWP